MRKIATIIFISIFFNLYSQSREKVLDSLKNEVIKIKDDSLKGEKVFKIAAIYRSINKDSAFFYSNRAEKIALKNEITSILGKVYNLKGSLNYDISKNDIALSYFYKSKAIVNKLNSYRGLGIIFNKLAIVHRNLYNLDSALYYNYETIKVFDSLNILPYTLHAKNNIANIFNELGNKEEALKQHLSIYKIRDSIKDYRGMMHSLGNLGDIYGDLNQFKKALEFYKKGINVAKKLNNEVALGRFYNNQASLYTDNYDFVNGLHYFKKALVLREKQKDLYGVSSTSLNIASILLMANGTKEAQKNIYKSISISRKYNLKDLLQEGYDLLSRAKLLLKENDSSFHYQRLSTNLLDSIAKSNYSEKLAELDTKYQTEKKEKELLQTRTEKAETELALSKTKNWMYILLAILAISGGTFFTINQRNKRKAQEQITQEKERGFKAIIDAQEEERSKIARELHDGVVQQIGSVILRSRNFFSTNKLDENKETEELIKSLENSNQDLRNISHQMMPRALKELGIIPALNDLLENSLSYSDIKFNLEHFNIENRLPEKIEVTIYRITQELINNIIKHSKANEVSVQLFKNNNNIILIVEDNGVGFSSKENKKGIGLLNISSRLNMVNGNVNFEPSPKSGTLVTIKIPL